MKTTLFAAALVAATVAGASIPIVAAAPGGGDETSLAQSAGAPVPPPAPETGQRPMRPGGPGMQHRPEIMERHMTMMQSPRERCIDRLAHRAGFRAYLGVRLNLNAAQRPLWERLQSVADNEEQQERQVCDHMKAGTGETVLDRIDAQQQLLTARAAGLQAAKEPLAALYKALTPEQRAILDHPRGFFHRP